MVLRDWDEAYRGVPPWDLGRPQPAFEALVRDGQIRHGRALDVGCGRGDNAIMLAKSGCQVTGIDIAKEAIEDARAKAAKEQVQVEFIQGSALELDRYCPQEAFDTVIDCGLFHVLSDEERPVYARQVHRVLKPGGRYFMMCFSDKQPGIVGPRRVSRREIEEIFSGLFRINYLRDSAFETRLDEGDRKAYLLSATRR